MIALLSIFPIFLTVIWIIAEFRWSIRIRIATGIAALVSVAVVAFLWGSFVYALRHMDFPVPGDGPDPTTENQQN